ncbi:MAG: NACHT C-terminal helical domain 2-containing protein, partial [Microcystis sp.]
YNISRSLFTFNFIHEFVRLVKLFAQYRIVSRVNFFQLIADLEALKQIIPDDKATRKEHQEFFYQLFKISNTAFNLTTELLNLSSNEINDIDKHYFYINRLILDCQKVAVNISPTVWQEIEERMLRVP